MVSERELLQWIAARAPIGDDCAVLECRPWGTLLAATDSVIDGVHLRWSVEGPRALGYKAVARSMSDVAAMAGEPLWALLAVCLPSDATQEQAREVYLGAESAGCPMAGGDTAFGPACYAVATVLGRAHPKGPVLRSGAREGDWIVVSGRLGGSLHSGRHATFEPRVDTARKLHETFELGAMIDISDGLSTDLGHILDASGVGCRLQAEAIPIHADSDLQGALNDGEDHELLFTMRPDDRLEGFLPGLQRIGVVQAGPSEIIDGSGKSAPLVRGGFEHGD